MADYAPCSPPIQCLLLICQQTFWLAWLELVSEYNKYVAIPLATQYVEEKLCVCGLNVDTAQYRQAYGNIHTKGIYQMLTELLCIAFCKYAVGTIVCAAALSLDFPSDAAVTFRYLYSSSTSRSPDSNGLLF